MTVMNNEDPADPSVHEPRVTDAPAEIWLVYGELPPPVAWVQPDHLQKARMAPFLCRVEPTQRHADFVPIYAADQMRAYWIEWAQRGMDRVDVARLVADCVPGGHVCDPQQVADAIRAWFAMTDDAVNTGPASPASDLPQPAAWVRNWTSPHPDCVTSLKYRSAADADRGVEYHPAYTADQMRAATAAMRAQDSAHRSAQAAVYAALGPGADPDRATWPDQIRALRERADAADTVAQGAAQVRG